eukprot:6459968-Amphidinium_carterae.1
MIRDCSKSLATLCRKRLDMMEEWWRECQVNCSCKHTAERKTVCDVVREISELAVKLSPRQPSPRSNNFT